MSSSYSSSSSPTDVPQPSPRSVASSWFGGRTAAEVTLQKERKRADKLARSLQASQRNTLIARRDVLNYFDHARSLGTLVFVDTVPLCMNAVLCVTVGTLGLFLDGGGSLNDSGGSCGGLVHYYVLCLMGVSYVLLGLMSFVAMGYRVVLDISAPFFALVCIVVAYCATWFFFGLPAFFTWFAVLVSPNPDPKSSTMTCLANAKLLFAFTAIELILAPFLSGILLIKWGLFRVLARLKMVLTLWAFCCKSRTALSGVDTTTPASSSRPGSSNNTKVQGPPPPPPPKEAAKPAEE